MKEREINTGDFEKPKSILEEIQEIIDKSPEKIEEEFKRTTNTWLDCFISRLFPIETYLSLRNAKAEVGSDEKYQDISIRLEDLKEKVADLKEQYPDKNTIPPEEAKKELFENLRNLI